MKVDFIRIIKCARIHHWFFITINVLLISWRLSLPTILSLQIAIAISLAASFGFLVNDIFDQEEDGLNDKRRLSNVSPRTLLTAKYASMACLLISVLSVANQSFLLVVLVLLLNIGLYFYASFFRKKIYANLICSFLVTSIYWIPLVIYGRTDSFISVFIFAIFLLIVSREIVFDIQDVYGDKIAGRKSIPVVFGIMRAGDISLLTSTLGIAVLYINLVTNEVYVIKYLYTTILGVLFLYPQIILVKNRFKGLFIGYERATTFAMLITPLLLL